MTGMAGVRETFMRIILQISNNVSETSQNSSFPIGSLPPSSTYYSPYSAPQIQLFDFCSEISCNAK